MTQLGLISDKLREELVTLSKWYRMTERELGMLLLGASLGLKLKGVVLPDLELAVTSGQPEIFMSKEKDHHDSINEQSHSEATHKQIPSSSFGGDQERRTEPIRA